MSLAALWFALAAGMAAAYVVLDGFDFGAGAIHLFVARSDRERRQVLAAIGPFWDGNEVWLLALGGVLFLAFPRILGAALSGFYLAIVLVVWTLILRGIAIEFRSHHPEPLWRAFWDGVFALASATAPVLLGAALGNLARGVPLGASGYFALPLWTDFRPGSEAGVLDWYTVSAGVLALAAIAHHGALFLAWKTTGEVEARARSWAGWLLPALALLWVAETVATALVAPRLLSAVLARPAALLAMVVAFAGLVTSLFARVGGRALLAFLGSTGFLVGVLAATAIAMYPAMLVSTLDPAYSLGADNAAASPHALATGLLWWPAGVVLAFVYLAVLLRLHRGKTEAAAEGEGY
jgi:cytochrome d ubiquinol oxidase subunit II